MPDDKSTYHNPEEGLPEPDGGETVPQGASQPPSETVVYADQPVYHDSPFVGRFKVNPGWTIPQPEHIPRPTYWPVVMALAVNLLAFGVVTSYLISILGVLLFILSLGGWIGELRNEQREIEQHGHE